MLQRQGVASSPQPGKHRLIQVSGQRLKSTVTVFASIIALGTIVLLGAVAMEQKRAAEERASNDADNVAGAFEQQVGLVLNNVRGAMALLKLKLSEDCATVDFVDWTKHVPQFAESTVQIAFVGPDGRLVATSLARAPQSLDLSDREHIRVHLSGGYKGLFIGKPVLGRISGQPTIQVSERVENADGKLLGVLVFSISPDFLTPLHRAVNLGNTGSMILAGDDGVIRASYGAWQKSDLDFVGQPLRRTPDLPKAAGPSEGYYRGENPLNGERAFLHWHKLERYPMIVMVSLGEDEAFAAANHSALMLFALGAGVLALAIATVFILNREISRRVDREVALVEKSRKLVDANRTLKQRHQDLLATSAELKAAKEQAEQANQAKTALLMNMSHEFRTPMHAVLNYANMALKKIPSSEPEKFRKYLTNIQSSGSRLLGLLNALLDLAKLESGKQELRPARGDLGQIIRQSQAELGSLFEAKQLHFHLQCNTRRTIGIFDGERLMQVFINLFSNAIKFSPQQGAIEVTVSDCVLPDQRQALHCIVSDQGVGIPEAEFETVFEKFTQSSKTDTGAGGTGLGLAICREIVHLHGGKIWAAAAPSGGAAFHVIVPRDPAKYASSQLLAEAA